MTKHFVACFGMALACVASGCGGGDDNAAPVATPMVTLSRSTVPVGGPVDVTYRFAMAPDAPPFTEALTVFVHILDEDGTILWTDDHDPTPSTREWKAGQVIEYTRTVFVPRLSYTGEARIEVGIYAPASGQRVALSGESFGGRAYRVGTFTISPQTEGTFVVFKDGWHDPEVADNGATEWQWSQQKSTLSFRNLRRDLLLLLQVDHPANVFPEPQQVEVSSGGDVVDRFALAPGQRELRRITLPAATLGDAQAVEITISVDKTFVPAKIPALRSADIRELGIRVLRAYVEPK